MVRASKVRDGRRNRDDCASRSGTADAGKVRDKLRGRLDLVRPEDSLSGDAAAGAEIAGAGHPGQSPLQRLFPAGVQELMHPTRRARPVRVVDRGLKASLGLLG